MTPNERILLINTARIVCRILGLQRGDDVAFRTRLSLESDLKKVESEFRSLIGTLTSLSDGTGYSN